MSKDRLGLELNMQGFVLFFSLSNLQNKVMLSVQMKAYFNFGFAVSYSRNSISWFFFHVPRYLAEV